MSDNDDDQQEDDDDDDDDEFRYPGSTAASVRPASRSSTSTDYFNRPGVSRAPTDLTPQLSQAPDFRVPTREAPQKILTPRYTSPTPYQVHAQWNATKLPTTVVTVSAVSIFLPAEYVYFVASVLLTT